MYRQGDVLLVPVWEIPPDALAIPAVGGRVILALGESTGHAHAVDARDADFLRSGEERYLHVRANTALRHEEHAAIPLPKGIYRVVYQREYRPGEIRRVLD